jgi:hypothetical protein
MAAVSFKMAKSDGFENTRPAPMMPVAMSARPEVGGIGWNDSSWDLQQGLQVVEDLPLDAWQDSLFPADLAIVD